MARRLGDPALLQHALVTAFVATWWPSSAAARLALVDEAAARARATATCRRGDGRDAAGGGARANSAASRRCGRRSPPRAGAPPPLRMAYLLLVLDAMEAPWLAMPGRDEEAERVLRASAAARRASALPQAADGRIGALVRCGSTRAAGRGGCR